ncbi:MAG: SRPBCC family protein, partial [Geminicoccaceae bacterium]
TQMRSINVSRRIPSAPAKVWAVLADFPNIATWNTGVAKSFATTDSTGGVGAQRHCDLTPFGELEETVKEWEDECHMVISIDSAKKLPIAHGEVTFVLSPTDDATEVSINYSYMPNFGLFERIMGSLVLDSQLEKGFKGFLKDLEAASQRQ